MVSAAAIFIANNDRCSQCLSAAKALLEAVAVAVVVSRSTDVNFEVRIVVVRRDVYRSDVRDLTDSTLQVGCPYRVHCPR